MKDSRIIELIRRQEEKGLSAFYDKYSSAIYGVTLRILNRPDLAEEVLSQTMLKVWDKIDSYSINKSSLFTWTMAIARNSALDKRRLKSFEHGQKTDSLDSTVYNVEAKNKSEFELDASTITGLVEEKYKVVLDKIYLEGYSQSEAAELLNIPLGTIKTRLRKAILILREKLKDEKSLFFCIILIFILIMFTYI